MTKPEYSVVVPDLHSPRIGEVLEALRRQEGVQDNEYEILVVGRDRYGLVRGHVSEDKRIRFLESERDLNPAEARNRGIKAAQGRLIFFIDADCIAGARWMITFLNTYSEDNPVVGGPIWFNRDQYWILCDNVAHFHDHVVATDERGKLRADAMDVYYNKGTKRVAKIIAVGNVVITNPDGNETFSDNVTYLAEEGRVILGGDSEALYVSDNKSASVL